MQPARLGARTWCFVAATLLGILVLAPPIRAQAVLETPQQTNQRIKTLSASASSRTVPHDYVIGRGDLLSVEVFEVQELTREVRVSQTGTIGLPLVPLRLHVAGLTEMQAQQKIAEVLEANGLISHPEVTVSVKEKKSKPITIVGAVAHPMVYQVDRPVTLLEVLAEAGGIANDAGDLLIVTRPEQTVPDSAIEPPEISPSDVVNAATTPSTSTSFPSASAAPGAGTPATSAQQPSASSASEPPPLSNTITVNLNNLLETGDVRNNIPLQGGDIVTVPHAGIVYVLGDVGHPGGFVVNNDRAQLSTLKALALAGGLNITAKKNQAVIIRKDAAGQQHQVIVDLDKVLKQQTEDVRLQASDILYVPRNGTKAALIKSAEIALGIGTAVAIYRIGNH
ncbi:MAG TPA: polysaccharide biosynthesis/export family protein [Candidatus Sulfotelmatobacter sp.]|jgi:polysaccharide export outer membrane protein|nr:polysaccharide biosynthesis/export family protein [Candidatus Sulfotelmatobacter sp.]